MCNHNASKTSGRRSSKRGVSRRDVIRYGVASTLGIAALGPLGRGILQSASGAPLPNHRRCVVIYCYGGYDGLQMVVNLLVGFRYRRITGLVPDPRLLVLEMGKPDTTRFNGRREDQVFVAIKIRQSSCPRSAGSENSSGT